MFRILALGFRAWPYYKFSLSLSPFLGFGFHLEDDMLSEFVFCLNTVELVVCNGNRASLEHLAPLLCVCLFPPAPRLPSQRNGEFSTVFPWFSTVFPVSSRITLFAVGRIAVARCREHSGRCTPANFLPIACQTLLLLNADGPDQTLWISAWRSLIS